MEPTTPTALSMAFATIVQLICNFITERRENRNINLPDFLEWLSEHSFEHERNFIEANQRILSEIQELLKTESKELIAKLENIDNILVKILSHICGYKEMAVAFKSEALLSDQAINILRQFSKSQSPKFFKRMSMGAAVGLVFMYGGHIEYAEDRFLDDDLKALVNLGLINFSISASGEECYSITRNAILFIDTIDENK